MSVGGRIIEMRRVTQRDADNPDFARDAWQIWVVDRNGDETIVFAKPQDDMPKLGDEIWWQTSRGSGGSFRASRMRNARRSRPRRPRHRRQGPRDGHAGNGGGVGKLIPRTYAQRIN